MAESFYGKGITVASGFDLGAKTPLDSRSVVNTIAQRDEHVTGNRVYEGMTVYVLEDKTTYQYVKTQDDLGYEWKVFGADAVDLSDYATKDYVTQAIADAVSGGEVDLSEYAKTSDVEEALKTKVDAVEGSRLMTDKEAAKLESLSNYDDTTLTERMDDIESSIPSADDYVSPGQLSERIEEIIGAAPEALDTLEEIAAALKDSDDAVAALTTTIAGKADAVHNHDGVYVKPADMEDALEAKAEASHTHTVSEITDFPEFPEIPDVSGFATTEYVDAGDTFAVDMNTVNDLGGIAAGVDLNGKSIQEVLTMLLYPYVKPSISASSIPNGGTYEHGATVNITGIKATVSKKSQPITKVEFLDGSSSLLLLTEGVAKGGTFNYTEGIEVRTNKAFTVKATDDSGVVVSATTGKTTFVYPYYMGVIAEDATVDAELVLSLTKVIEDKGSKSKSYTCDNQKMVFAYPKSHGVIKQILDPNNFDVTGTFTRSEIAITGLDETEQAYYVYTNAASTVSNFSMKFSY